LKHLIDTNKLNLTDTKIAIAGRSSEKLKSVLHKHMGDHSSSIGIIIASIENEKTMMQMCKKTKVVVSTVGP